MIRRSVLLLFLFLFALVLAAEPQRKSPNSGVIVIPSGTKITVQLNYANHATGSSVEGKVVWPVQIGFKTVIAVGSRVKAATFTQYADTDRRHTTPVEMVQLATITVDDNTYDVESTAVQVETGTTETKFTLVSDLKI